MDTINTRQGETLELEFKTDNPLAVEATLYVGVVGESPILVFTVPIADSIANMVIHADDYFSNEIGEYKYQVNLAYADERVEIYPIPEDCQNGELPDFNIYASLGDGVVS